MPALLLAEHDNENLRPATLNAATAALKLGEVDVLVAGKDCARAISAAARIPGVRKVLACDAAAYAHQGAENMAALVMTLAPAYTHILGPATAFGKNVLPRAAALLDAQMLSDVTAIVDDATFQRPVYAGNALATVRSRDRIKILTVRATAFAAANGAGGNAAVEKIAGADDAGLSAFSGRCQPRAERPDLAGARVVVAGGRGLGSALNFRLVEALADRLGGAVGATRAAVDAGFAPNHLQVGQTGKIVAPDLYIAVGVSGAIQHLAGMKESKVVVAINTDGGAPIFEAADYGLVEDLFTAVPELIRMLG